MDKNSTTVSLLLHFVKMCKGVWIIWFQIRDGKKSWTILTMTAVEELWTWKVSEKGNKGNGRQKERKKNHWRLSLGDLMMPVSGLGIDRSHLLILLYDYTFLALWCFGTWILLSMKVKNNASQNIMKNVLSMIFSLSFSWICWRQYLYSILFWTCVPERSCSQL